MSDINNTLQERGNRYGEFPDHSAITQALKSVIQGNVIITDTNGFGTVVPFTNWNSLSPAHKEALEMIAHKIGRILNGDPNYKDSWHDISGYSKLGEEACQE